MGSGGSRGTRRDCFEPFYYLYYSNYPTILTISSYEVDLGFGPKHQKPKPELEDGEEKLPDTHVGSRPPLSPLERVRSAVASSLKKRKKAERKAKAKAERAKKG